MYVYNALYYIPVARIHPPPPHAKCPAKSHISIFGFCEAVVNTVRSLPTNLRNLFLPMAHSPPCEMACKESYLGELYVRQSLTQ